MEVLSLILYIRIKGGDVKGGSVEFIGGRLKQQEKTRRGNL